MKSSNVTYDRELLQFTPFTQACSTVAYLFKPIVMIMMLMMMIMLIDYCVVIILLFLCNANMSFCNSFFFLANSLITQFPLK